MLVVVVMPGVGPEGGAEQSLLAMAPALRDCGVELHLVVLSSYQSSVADFERSGVMVHDLSGAAGLLSRVRRLRALVGSVQPDVLHAVLWDATLAAQLASVGTRTPLLISWTVTSNADRRLDEHPEGRWKRRAVELVDAVLGRISRASYHAVTEGVASSMVPAIGAPRSRVHVGERGRDLERFAGPFDVERTRRSLGLAPEDRVVLAVGRQDRQKGYSSLLEAFDRVVDAVPTARLLIAGREGSATPQLRTQLTELRNPGSVMWLGQRDDVPDLLAVAELFVCASWREGAAGAMLEAMASGTPVVSVRLAGLEGVLVDGANARVVARANLAEGVLELLEDRGFASTLADRAGREVVDRFTIERAAQRMSEIYRSVAAERRPGRARR